jgi:NAD(P)-dependent dehydrogenase (short-subunit alcohol dehydrogenase family)
MATALITGANRGIGLEFVRRLSLTGWRVLATCRSPEQAEALRRIAADSRQTVEVHLLDTADPQSIGALSAVLGDQAIDLLVCSAGVSKMKQALITGEAGQRIQDADDALWFEVYRTNAIGPLRVAAAFADRVAASERRLMAFLSTHMSSVAQNNSGAYYMYRASKAALNVIVKNLSIELAPRGITCIALHPGWVRTDMGGRNAEISPEESVSGMLRILLDPKLSKKAQFLDYRGETVPW